MSVEPYPDLEIGDGKPIALSTQYADEDRICQAAWVTGITMREITQWVTDHLAGSAPQIPPELQETALQTLHVSVTTAPAWRVIDFTAGASLHVGDTPVYCRIQLQHSRHGERERFELTATVGLPLRGRTTPGCTWAEP